MVPEMEKEKKIKAEVLYTTVHKLDEEVEHGTSSFLIGATDEAQRLQFQTILSSCSTALDHGGSRCSHYKANTSRKGRLMWR